MFDEPYIIISLPLQSLQEVPCYVFFFEFSSTFPNGRTVVVVVVVVVVISKTEPRPLWLLYDRNDVVPLTTPRNVPPSSDRLFCRALRRAAWHTGAL